MRVNLSKKASAGRQHVKTRRTVGKFRRAVNMKIWMEDREASNIVITRRKDELEKKGRSRKWRKRKLTKMRKRQIQKEEKTDEKGEREKHEEEKGDSGGRTGRREGK